MRSARQFAGVVAMLGPAVLVAQTAERRADRLAEGDRLYASRDAARALGVYERVIAGDSGAYAALWKAARTATDLGEFEPHAKRRGELYARARDYATRAVRANVADAEGHFELARAVGRTALAAGVRERVRLAGAVRQHTLDALARNRDHAGAMHVLGVWHAEVMRLSRFERMMARTFLGGGVLGEANWAEAVRLLERAVEREPTRIVHRLDLGRIYADVGRKDAARAQLEWVARAAPVEFNDANYKRLAADALRGLK